jgi:hypothetical protein
VIFSRYVRNVCILFAHAHMHTQTHTRTQVEAGRAHLLDDRAERTLAARPLPELQQWLGALLEGGTKGDEAVVAITAVTNAAADAEDAAAAASSSSASATITLPPPPPPMPSTFVGSIFASSLSPPASSSSFSSPSVAVAAHASAPATSASASSSSASGRHTYFPLPVRAVIDSAISTMAPSAAAALAAAVAARQTADSGSSSSAKSTSKSKSASSSASSSAAMADALVAAIVPASQRVPKFRDRTQVSTFPASLSCAVGFLRSIVLIKPYVLIVGSVSPPLCHTQICTLTLIRVFVYFSLHAVACQGGRVLANVG